VEWGKHWQLASLRSACADNNVELPPYARCTAMHHAATHTHTHLFNSTFSETTRVVNRYQKGKTKLDFTEARDGEWQCHQLGRVQVCTSLQTDSHASTPPLISLQAGCPSCRPTNSVKALKAMQQIDRYLLLAQTQQQSLLLSAMTAQTNGGTPYHFTDPAPHTTDR